MFAKNYFMERSNFAKFLDNIALATLCFIFLYITINKYIKNIWLKLSICLLITFVFIKIVRHFQNKRFNKLGIKNEEIRQIETLNFELRSMTKIKQNQTIKKLLSDNFSEYKNSFFITKNSVAILNKLDTDFASNSDIFFILSHSKFLEEKQIKEVAIFCNNIDKNIMQIKSKNCSFKITYITPELIYSLFKIQNLIPENLSEKPQKVKKKVLKPFIFAKNQAKYLFRCSLAIFFISLFVPFSRYYITIGTITLIVSLVMYIFGSKPKQISPSILLENK